MPAPAASLDPSGHWPIVLLRAFEEQYKASAYREARDQAALAVCELLLQGGEPARQLADDLEQELMSAFSGLLRRLGRRQREQTASLSATG